jgi:drug/metabolite transporter (DMT)-like permease
MIAHIGELAALGTAVSWTIGALVMEEGVKRVGVMAVNTLKVAFGSLYLAVLALALTGHLFPLNVPPVSWAYLAASGFIGFVIGDYFLLHAYAMIGSRLAMLLLALSVPLTALSAWIVWGERPGLAALAGMALCVIGICLTVMAGWKGSKRGAAAAPDAPNSRRYRKGVIYGCLSAIATVIATLFTKSGAAGVDPVNATQIRIASAFAGFLLVAVAAKKSGEIVATFRSRRDIALVATGGFFGPFVGVGCMLFALQHAEAGIVSTLTSLSPVLIILPSVLFFKRKVFAAEIIGACLAMVGLALMFA